MGDDFHRQFLDKFRTNRFCSLLTAGSFIARRVLDLKREFNHIVQASIDSGVFTEEECGVLLEQEGGHSPMTHVPPIAHEGSEFMHLSPHAPSPDHMALSPYKSTLSAQPKSAAHLARSASFNQLMQEQKQLHQPRPTKTLQPPTQFNSPSPKQIKTKQNNASTQPLTPSGKTSHSNRGNLLGSGTIERRRSEDVEQSSQSVQSESDHSEISDESLLSRSRESEQAPKLLESEHDMDTLELSRPLVTQDKSLAPKPTVLDRVSPNAKKVNGTSLSKTLKNKLRLFGPSSFSASTPKTAQKERRDDANALGLPAFSSASADGSSNSTDSDELNHLQQQQTPQKPPMHKRVHESDPGSEALQTVCCSRLHIGLFVEIQGSKTSQSSQGV